MSLRNVTGFVSVQKFKKRPIVCFIAPTEAASFSFSSLEKEKI